jgi:uncharacterized protein
MRLKINFQQCLLLLVSLLFFIILSSYGYTNSLPEIPSNYVVDLAGIIEFSEEVMLNKLLGELEEKTTAQFIVLTVKTLEGAPIEEFSLEVAEKWRLGQKDTDNGLLLVISMKERRYRFEVGYGLEEILPDAKVGSIGRKHLVQNFRAGNYSKGLLSATTVTATIIARENGVVLSNKIVNPIRSVPRKKKSLKDLIEILAALFVVFLFGIFVYFGIKKPPGTGTRGGRYWSTYGGFGSGGGSFGSGGGFGGGGGGGFGGGGASGGW